MKVDITKPYKNDIRKRSTYEPRYTYKTDDFFSHNKLGTAYLF